MIKKVFRIIKYNFNERKRNKENIKLTILENQWAHNFHDSIRGKVWLETLPLNIGRWAGNYTFFYVLNRILQDCKPESILEFGLGESSKFISTYLKNDLKNTKHLIIEHNKEWLNTFILNFNFTENTKIEICPLIDKKINNKKVSCYKNIDQFLDRKHQLYVIDGPIGSKNYSRYDAVKIIDYLNKKDQFILILDDIQRKGEKETAKIIFNRLNEKGIKFTKRVYKGNKSVLVIGSEKYKYVNTL